ncbi:MAG: hypothetical protein ACJ786_06830, partial [Catenulispora sp.]
DVLPFVGPGNDPAIATINGKLQVITSATGGALTETAPDGSQTRVVQQMLFGPASDATDKTGELNLFEGASVGDLLGTGTPAVVKYGLGLAGAANLLLVGQNVPYNHLIGAFDAGTGLPLPAYPTVTDDYQFLSASNIAKLGTGRTSQVLAGTGLGLLHAYDGATGRDVPGFPKQTGGWLFSPAALAADGRMADITREGYLFEWRQGQPSCQPTGQEWPSFRHDPHDSGNFDTDATAPAAPAAVRLTNTGGGQYRLQFVVPGDDGFCGPNARSFRAEVDGRGVDPLALGLGVPNGYGSTASVTVTLDRRAHSLAFSAVDRAGNVGMPATVPIPHRVGVTSTGGGRTVGRPRHRGGTRSRLVIGGRLAFVAPGGVTGLLAACFGSTPCRGSLRIAGPGGATLGSRRAFAVSGNDGTILHVRLTRRARLLLARSPHHHLSVTVNLLPRGARARTRAMTLVTFRSPLPRLGARIRGISALRAFGRTAFVSPQGRATVFVGCFARQACRGAIRLVNGGRVLGALAAVRVARASATLVSVPLTPAALSRVRSRGALVVTLVVRGPRRGRQSSTVMLVPYA